MSLDFAQILDPYPLSQFLEIYWERDVLHIARDAVEFYAPLMTRGDVERLLVSGRRGSADTRLSLRGMRVGAEHYTDADGTSMPAVYKLYAGGASIILNGIQSRHDGVRELGRSIEQALEFPASTNLYATPPSSRGFDTHFDRHEVFVLQIHGTKRWRIFDRGIELPLHALDEQLAPPAMSDATPRRELELRPGDLLYLPRGVRHDACTDDGGASIHLSIGVLTTTFHDLLLAAVSAVAVADVELRRSLPPGYLSSGPTDSLRERAGALLARVADAAPFDAAWRRLAGAYKGSNPALDDHLARLDRLAELTLTSVLRRRQQVFPVVGVDGDRAHIRFAGAHVFAPVAWLPALMFVAEHASFALGALPQLDDDARLALAHRLITEGLLTPA